MGAVKPQGARGCGGVLTAVPAEEVGDARMHCENSGLEQGSGGRFHLQKSNTGLFPPPRLLCRCFPQRQRDVLKVSAWSWGCAEQKGSMRSEIQ